jgi:hypothetical protein
MRWDDGPRFLIPVGRVRILVPSCSTLRPIQRCWILRGLSVQLPWRRWAVVATWLGRPRRDRLASQVWHQTTRNQSSLERPAHHKAASARGRVALAIMRMHKPERARPALLSNTTNSSQPDSDAWRLMKNLSTTDPTAPSIWLAMVRLGHLLALLVLAGNLRLVADSSGGGSRMSERNCDCRVKFDITR